VYVEIHDDTGGSASCYASLFGTAPSNASYDERYYGRDGSYYQYRAYYQAPGSSTIEYLGWGDFYNHYTTQVASSEVRAPTINGQTPKCPVLGDITNGHWNILGNPNSNTFASYLQFWTGSSWVDWTSDLHHSTNYANLP
jgi:hypothetical protein